MGWSRCHTSTGLAGTAALARGVSLVRPGLGPDRRPRSVAGCSARLVPRRPGRWTVACGLFLVAVLDVHRIQAAGTETGSENPPEPAAEQPRKWTGSVSLLEEYRLRRSSHVLAQPGPLGEAAAARDQIDHRVRLHADAEADGFDDHFRALLAGALWWDANGAPAGQSDLFASQYDGSRLWVAPYVLSAEWRDQGILDHIRIGRQDTEHGLPLTFDGASIGLRPFGRTLLLYGFGGQTVHFFETMPGLLEDWVASVGGVLRPSPTVQLELDGRVVQDRLERPFESSTVDVTSYSYGFTASTRTEHIAAKAQLRGLDEQVSHAAGAMVFYMPSAHLGINSEIYSQLVTLDEVAESENPFYSLLGPSLPYVRHKFELSHELQLGSEALWTNLLGWRARRLVGHKEQPFNHNAGAVYLHTRVDDVFTHGLFFGATAEWNYVPSSPGDAWLLAGGGAAGYDGGRFMTEIGTYYQRYKINYYQRAEELHNARTVYGSLGYRVASWLELKGRYEMEIVDRFLESFFLSARQYY